MFQFVESFTPPLREAKIFPERAAQVSLLPSQACLGEAKGARGDRWGRWDAIG